MNKRNTKAPADAGCLRVMDVMPKYIGARYAFLLHLVGYKTLQDLNEAYDVAIIGIPGIGPARIKKIEQALNEFGFMMRISPPFEIPIVGQQPPRLALH